MGSDKGNNNFFERIRQRLFPSREQQKDQQGNNLHLPVHKEMIERSEEFLQEQQAWLDRGEHHSSLQLLAEAFQLKNSGQKTETELFLHSSPYGCGLFFPPPPGIEEEENEYLFDLLRDRVLGIGYRKYLSDRRILEHEDHYETIDRHYLKPPINKNMNATITDQLYGNILIEYHRINEQPSIIKIMASIYSDAKFTRALPFEEFVEKILSNRS